MAAILIICKLGVTKWPNVINIFIIEFLDLENMGMDTRIKCLQVSDLEIQAKLGLNGGHFEFMQIKHWSTSWILVNF